MTSKNAKRSAVPKLIKAECWLASSAHPLFMVFKYRVDFCTNLNCIQRKEKDFHQKFLLISFDKILKNERKIRMIESIVGLWAQSGWVELFFACLIIFITTTAIMFISQKNSKSKEDQNGNAQNEDKSGEGSTPPESDETKNKLPRQYRRVSLRLYFKQ